MAPSGLYARLCHAFLVIIHFATKFTAFTEQDLGHICSKISLQYSVLFKNYLYLNLKVHFF